jgi:hypothetical protein
MRCLNNEVKESLTFVVYICFNFTDTYYGNYVIDVCLYLFQYTIYCIICRVYSICRPMYELLYMYVYIN